MLKMFQMASPQLNLKTKTEKICPFYRKGICRCGSSGRGCLNEHSRPCKKLIQHGNKAPNGCTLGRAKCDIFHPKMCHYSLSKGICQNADCKLRHVIGTKKISNKTGTIEKNRKKGTRDTTVGRDPINGGNSDAFLDMLNRIKAEMLEAVDARVAQCMPAQPQLPATGNCTRIAAPRMTMAGPASYMTQGMQGYHYPITMQWTTMDPASTSTANISTNRSAFSCGKHVGATQTRGEQ